MCGFTGYIDMRARCRADKDVLVKMTDTLIHRGPDSYGYFVEDHVGFGFRRLSIIDLAGGDQPMYSEDESVVLLCNGEIFNYRELRDDLIKKGHIFRTNCDVEVLIHLYETYKFDFLNKLNGQFAFVIYDRKEQILFLARDHVGIIPLYYTIVDGIFVFASEIKAILKHPMVDARVNLTGIDQILLFPGLVSPMTMFKDIHSLKSGHRIIVKQGDVKVEEYWDIDYPKIGECDYKKSDEYYIETLQDILVRSVKYRLQSDVPVGFYLSGGIDSSLIAAIIKALSPDTTRHSFSIAFLEKEMSEAKYQDIMAQHVNSIHHKIVFDWSEIAQRLSDMIYHCECPVKETYNTCSMALSRAAKDTDISVILTGEGADELFAGYVGYRFDQFGTRDDERFDLEALLEEELREKIWGDRNIFYEKDLYAFQEVKAALYSSHVNELFEEFDCLQPDLVNKERLKDRHMLHQRSYLDFKLRLSDHLISDHGDRMAMAHSVEARYPFLDRELIEFARYIPPDLKLKRQTEKYIVKKIAQDFLPADIVNRQKFGFHAPGSSYLLQQHIDWIDDLLSYERIKRQGYFNPDVVEKLKVQYSQPGFKLNLPFESDLLIIVLTFGLFLDLFDLPNAC